MLVESFFLGKKSVRWYFQQICGCCELGHLLEKAKVAVSDGSLFGSCGEGHVRINIATSREILTEAFDRIQTPLGEL